MAVFSTLEAVEKQMERSGCHFWWCYDSDKTVISANKEKSQTVADSFELLKDLVESQEGDFVIIVIRSKLPNLAEDGTGYKKGGDNRSGEKYEFRIRIKQAPGMQGRSNGSMDSGLHGLYTMLGEMKADNVRIAKDAEIAALTLKLEEAKKSNDKGSYTDKMIDHIAKEFVKNLTGKETVSKKISDNVEEHTDASYTLDDKDKSKVIADGLGRVANVMKGETYDLIEKLGKMATDNPEEFKMQAKMILESE